MELFKKPSINEQSVISVNSVPSNIYEDQEMSVNKNFSKEQFIKLMKDISSQNVLYSYPEEDLNDIYDKIIQAKQKVSDQDFNCFIQAVKQKNKQSFQSQLQSYQNFIKVNKAKGKKTIQSQSLKTWIEQKQPEGYIGEALYKKANQLQYISLEKLQQFLSKIKNKFKNQSQIIIPHRISLNHSSFSQEQLDFDLEDSQISLNKIQYLKSMVSKFITDPMAEQKILKQLTKLSLLIIELQQNKMPSLKEQIQNLRMFNKQLENGLIQVQEQLSLKSDQNIKYQNQLIELTQQNHDIKKQFIKTKLQLSDKQEQNEQLRIINIKYQTDLQTKNQQTKQYATQFIKLKNEFQQVISKQQQNKIKQKQEQAKNLFPTRSLKQQLEDANIKLKKLKDQKNKLLTDLQSNQQNYQMKIQNLQKELEELRNQKIRTTQLKINGLSQYSGSFAGSRISRSIFSSVTSVYLGKKQNQQQKKSKQQQKKAKQQQKKVKQQQKKQMQNILQKIEEQNKKNKTKNKFSKKQNIQVFQAELMAIFDSGKQQQDQKTQNRYNFVNMDFDKLKKTLNLQGLLSVIEEDCENQNKKSSFFQNKQIKNQSKDSPSSKKQNKMFISKANIISKGGNKFQKYILITPKAIYFLDTKMRNQKEIFFQKIDKFIFCYNNIDIFLISFKRTQSPLKKKSITHEKDIIISIKQRKQLIEFFHQETFMKIFTQSKIKSVFAKQEDVWVKQNDDSTTVLSMYKNMYNPFRLIVSWKQCQNNAFKLQLSKEAFLSKTYYCLAIFQSSGLYCFQFEQDLLERVRPFIYLLPLVKRLNIQKKQKSIIRFQYLDWSDMKTFLLKFQTQKQANIFVKQCKKQIQANDNMLIGREKVGYDLLNVK